MSAVGPWETWVQKFKSNKDWFCFFSFWFSQNVGIIAFSLQMVNFYLMGHMATSSSLDSHLLALPLRRIHALVPAPIQDYLRAEC